jgi:oligopeptide transport system substrate-binding protein
MVRRALLLAALTAVVLVGCEGGSGSTTPRMLRVAIGNEPSSLDPGQAVDSASQLVVTNIGDPLVRLGENSEAVPGLARSWEWSADGRTITFHLREDGRWTNGDPVTAHDFEWSWKRLASPELGLPYSYYLYGVVGGRAYNECEKSCAALREKVGVSALDDTTLQVRLTSRQPWFPAEAAHSAMLAVHQATVERFGKAWTEPGNIVTNGPFKLASWNHDKSVVLVKNPGWRDADQVWLVRVVSPIISDPAVSVQAFRRGAIDATIGDQPLPAEDARALTESGELATYPFLFNQYYGFNVENIPDLNQRRAMAFAIGRAEFIQALGFPGIPATGFVPPAVPGFDLITQEFLSPEPDLRKARAFMRRARHPKLTITLYLNNLPEVIRSGEIAREAWAKLGITTRIKALEWAQFLEAVGPPPREDLDLARFGWIGDFADAYNFLQLFSCGDQNNWWNFCDPAYDRLLHRATRTLDPGARYRIYAELERRLTGSDGPLPVIPLQWGALTSLEKPSIASTFNLNPHGYIDLAAVRSQS